MRLGYVGLGAMGLPFARHMKEAGHEVAVFNRSDRPYAAARAAGMQIEDSLEACVAKSEMLFTCLPSLEIVEDIFTRIDKPGLICVDNSTVPQHMALRLNADLKARGMAYVECPIFGSAEDAESARTYLVISGEDAPVETALPVAAKSARGITHVGGPGAASLVKILQNGSAMCRWWLSPKRWWRPRRRVLTVTVLSRLSASAGAWLRPRCSGARHRKCWTCPTKPGPGSAWLQKTPKTPHSSLPVLAPKLP